jgi:dephospho-CoA kinase
MMLVIGLTGSIGMGKSAVAAALRARNIPVFDADAAVHALYEGAAVAAVEQSFPGTTANGRVDRQKLSAILLADPTRFKDLERIVHPLVRDAQRQFLHDAAARGERMAVLEIPLLFEGGGEKFCDVTLVVSAPPDVQRTRVLARPGMTAAKLDEILSRQMPDAEKRRRADFVVDTGVPLAETHAALDRILLGLTSHAAQAYATHWA